MLEWFKTGFGLGLGVIAAAAVSLMALGLWDWVAIYLGKLWMAVRHKRLQAGK
jgi:hypothetical protein